MSTRISMLEENAMAEAIMGQKPVVNKLAVQVCGGHGELIESSFQKELTETNNVVSTALKSNLTENWFGMTGMMQMNKPINAPVVEAKEPAAKFAKGDKVKVVDGDKVIYTGEVFQVGDFDAFIPDRRYKIKIDGQETKLTFNEKSLKKATQAKAIKEDKDSAKKYSLVLVEKNNDGKIDGNWITNIVGTLADAKEKAKAYLKANPSNELPVAITAELSTTVGHNAFQVKAIDIVYPSKKEEVKEDVDGWKNLATKSAWRQLSNDEKQYNATLKVAKDAKDLAAKAKPFVKDSDVDWDEIYKAHAGKTEAHEVGGPESEAWSIYVNGDFVKKTKNVQSYINQLEMDGLDVEEEWKSDKNEVHLTTSDSDEKDEAKDYSKMSNKDARDKEDKGDVDAKIEMIKRREKRAADLKKELKHVHNLPKKHPSEKVESLINKMLDKSLNLCESKNSDARKVAYFLNERFVPVLETLIEAKEDKEEVELSPEEAKKVLEKVQKGLETILGKVTDEDLQKDIQDYIDQVEDILNPEEDEEEGEDEEGSEEGEEKEPKEIEEDKDGEKVTLGGKEYSYEYDPKAKQVFYKNGPHKALLSHSGDASEKYMTSMTGHPIVNYKEFQAHADKVINSKSKE